MCLRDLGLFLLENSGTDEKCRLKGTLLSELILHYNFGLFVLRALDRGCVWFWELDVLLVWPLCRLVSGREHH
jgi:hypothetical protein